MIPSFLQVVIKLCHITRHIQTVYFDADENKNFININTVTVLSSSIKHTLYKLFSNTIIDLNNSKPIFSYNFNRFHSYHHNSHFQSFILFLFCNNNNNSKKMDIDQVDENPNWLFDYGLMEDISGAHFTAPAPPSAGGFTWPSPPGLTCSVPIPAVRLVS